jgi:Na+/H+ antiporter NhaD/arsenite permease-like protein
MAPLVSELAADTGNPQSVLWWALALGADLGGNATIIGASANVILASLADREGYSITFGRFLRYGLPVTLGSIAVSALYLWVRYLL